MDKGYAGPAAKLRAAREQVVQVAARWQAGGIDTSPLSAALVAIQEVIAELEAPRPVEPSPELGGQLRKHFDAVRACGAGLETEDRPLSRLRWLDMIEEAAERCIETIDRMERS